MNSDSEEENPDWNRFWSYIPHPEESHHWGNVWNIGMIMNGGRNKRK